MKVHALPGLLLRAFGYAAVIAALAVAGLARSLRQAFVESFVTLPEP
jgi:hypothetical protein